jgi:aminopeptidase YwaD
MQNKLKIVIIFFFIIFSKNLFSQTFQQAYQNIVNQVSQQNVLDDLTQFEALGRKAQGNAALVNTLDWLKNKYLSYGYSASQMSEHTYTYNSTTNKNLIITKIGTVYPNIFVIIDGHYDTLNGTGTNDNGSGIACILETARLLQNVPTEYSIKFINFSCEEDGLIGSQRYVSQIVNSTTPKLNIRLVLNIDEVGGVDSLTNDTITCERDTNNNPSTNNAQSTTFTNQLMNIVGLYSPLTAFLSYAYASDYMSFQSNNEIITGLFEKNETTHKHTTSDYLIYMDPVYNYKVAKVAVGAMLHFAIASTALATTNFENDFQVSFFPNPSKDILNINLGSLLDSDYTFSLIDINGKTVFKKEIQNAKQIEQISTTIFAKGMYLGVLENSKNRISKKIVLE